MTEFLVVLACAYGNGCSQTASAYYGSHPALKQEIKRHGDAVKTYLGPSIVALYPAVPLLTHGKGTINFGSHYSLSVSNKDKSGIIFYKINF